MKYSILVLLLFSQFQAVFSQRTKEEVVIYTDTRLPLKPISTIKSYDFTVSTPYPENNNSVKELAKKKYEEDLSNYPNVVADAERKHEEALITYEEDVVRARENFKIENDAFDNMTLVERMALSDKKPVLKLPRKPVYYKPAEPRYVEPDLTRSIVYDSKMLSSIYLKLNGYEKGEDNALVGQIKLSNFEYTEPERKSKEVSYYDKASGSSKTRIEYYYIVTYRRPVEITLQHNGDLIFSGLLEGSSDYKTLQSTSSPNIFSLEKKSVEESLVGTNEFINNLYGYTPIEIKREIRYVKNKDDEYDDLEKAKDFAVSGYSSFKYTEKNTDLEQAISMWVKTLSESDVEDRKARIDEKVTRIVLLNVIEAAIVVNDYKTAEEQIKVYEKLKNNTSENKLIAQLKADLEDKRERFNAPK